ncbi:hypothetical protein ANCDUO_10071 [Ancylostoma duodenale]|uniref:Uncharacterized protein n=1 Tax=Ancylostoma duodenale TaxID=51022 RepID=A0A0C2DB88_9BILA|nr:hypothetical protein ANCDUO_10071 [Ancylostoma duodenale]
MGMKTEHWDLLGEAITETIREYQGWKRHRESLRAANILVSFLVDRIRTGFLQRDVATPNGTPTIQRILNEVPDRERSKSLQDSYHGLLHCGWTDSCPSIKDTISPASSCRKKESPKPKRSLPCMSSSKETRLEMQENIEKTEGEKEPDEEAIVNELVQTAGRDAAIHVLKGFNDLKRNLHDFMREKQEEGVGVITAEHITSFFDKIKRSRVEESSGDDF